jgi:flagellar protein FlaG
MLVKPVAGSGKSTTLSSQAGVPADQGTTQRGDKAQESVQTLSLTELSALAADAQKNIDIIHNVKLQFTVNKDSGRVVITVTDEATGEVVREIPPSEIVKFAEKFDEMVGMIFDQKG